MLLVVFAELLLAHQSEDVHFMLFCIKILVENTALQGPLPQAVTSSSSLTNEEHRFLSLAEQPLLLTFSPLFLNFFSCSCQVVSRMTDSGPSGLLSVLNKNTSKLPPSFNILLCTFLYVFLLITVQRLHLSLQFTPAPCLSVLYYSIIKLIIYLDCF